MICGDRKPVCWVYLYDTLLFTWTECQVGFWRGRMNMFHTIRQISQILPFKTGKEKRFEKVVSVVQNEIYNFPWYFFRLDLPKISIFFHSTFEKTGCKNIWKVKLFSLHLQKAGLNFTNIFTYSFYARSSQKHKNSVKLSVTFYTFGIYWRKSCS